MFFYLDLEHHNNSLVVERSVDTLDFVDTSAGLRVVVDNLYNKLEIPLFIRILEMVFSLCFVTLMIHLWCIWVWWPVPLWAIGRHCRWITIRLISLAYENH